MQLLCFEKQYPKQVGCSMKLIVIKRLNCVEQCILSAVSKLNVPCTIHYHEWKKIQLPKMNIINIATELHLNSWFIHRWYSNTNLFVILMRSDQLSQLINSYSSIFKLHILWRENMDKARLFYFSNAQCQQNGNGEDLDINIFLIP